MLMGRRRTIKPKNPLPIRVYEKYGKFWFVPKPAEVEQHGGKKWIDLGTDYHDALIKHRNMTTTTAGTLAHVWARYKVNILPTNAPGTQDNKIAYWKRLAPVYGHCFPDDIDPADIYDYLDARAAQGGTVSANREIALLSHMYTKAIRWRMARRNPCLSVERNLATPKQKTYITDERLAAWLRFASPKLSLYTQLEYMIGQRCSDVLHLKLSQIKDGFITLRASKTGKEGTHPITDDLGAVIKELRALRVNKKGVEYLSEYLILTRRGKPYTKSGFDSNWAREMGKFKKEGFEPFSAKQMRSRYADDVQTAGGDAARNLQHSNRQVTERHYLTKPDQLMTLPRPKY